MALIPRHAEISMYLDSFQHRVQGCSFPHIPEACTRTEIERFLSNAEHNALLHPDMLALLFAILAQGLQHGLYDRCGEQWLAEPREAESKKADVFSRISSFWLLNKLTKNSCCLHAGSEASVVHEQTNFARNRSPDDDLPLSCRFWQDVRRVGFIWHYGAAGSSY